NATFQTWLQDVTTVSGTGVLCATGDAISEPEADVPREVALEANYPNPFTSRTLIRYSLPDIRHVSLEVYDGLGRRVAVLVNETQGAGQHEARWETSARSSWIYMYRLVAGDDKHSGRMILLR